MPTLLQIAVEVNSGSVGRIAEQIGEVAISNGWTSYIAYARNHNPSRSRVIKIGSMFDVYMHVILTRLFGKHCLYSSLATKRLIARIEKINPDIIHLHHIHGYFINMQLLFNYLQEANKLVVWTFHDCWSVTGHCCYFTSNNCNKWKTQCKECPLIQSYPSQLFVDDSEEMFSRKKALFSSVPNMIIVSVSKWLNEIVSNSFLSNIEHTYIYNGVDTNVFRPNLDVYALREKYGIPCDKFVLIGVATTWTGTKGLSDFIRLSKIINEHHLIVLVGLNKKQVKSLPKNIMGISRTENVQQLADYYSLSNVHITFSEQETFGLTVAESMACGTPVIVYNTTALPELVLDGVGYVVEKKNVKMAAEAIAKIESHTKDYYIKTCRKRVECYFDKYKNYSEYIQLYNTKLQNTIHK